MGLKQEIVDKVKTIVEDDFSVEDVSYVPDIINSKLTFGNTGLRFETTVLYIDMRGSSEILNKHNKTSVAKMHMAYFHAVVKIAKSLGGEVRSFNGDSILVFFQGTTQNILSTAVKAAMQMVYILSNSENGVNKYLSKYSPLNFGIGIDYGHVLCTKIGLAGDANNQDLMWIGNAVNKATVISDTRKSPYYLGISRIVYANLQDNVKVHIQKNNWGQETNMNMWTGGTISYNNQTENYYYTNFHWTVE